MVIRIVVLKVTVKSICTHICGSIYCCNRRIFSSSIHLVQSDNFLAILGLLRRWFIVTSAAPLCESIKTLWWSGRRLRRRNCIRFSLEDWDYRFERIRPKYSILILTDFTRIMLGKLLLIVFSGLLLPSSKILLAIVNNKGNKIEININHLVINFIVVYSILPNSDNVKIIQY